MLEKRLNLADEVAKKKQEVLENFDKMMQRNKGISVEYIKELFPDDKELIKRVIGNNIITEALKAGNYEEISKNMPNTFYSSLDQKQNSTYKFNSNRESPSKFVKEDDDEDDNIKYTPDPTRELEIQTELERYRQTLQDDLLKVINEEKQKEEERETFYNNLMDEEEKKKAEIMINLQRSESSRRVVTLKQ